MRGAIDRRRLVAGLGLGAVGLSVRRGGLAAQSAPAIETQGRIVGTEAANVRACAGVDCGVRGTAKLGEAVTVTGEAVGDWLPVRWNGAEGFVYRLYVQTPAGTPELRRGAPGCGRVALLVNLGVGYPFQIEPLRWLAANDVPATIFPMGWWAKENAAAPREVAAPGFPIGSHGDQRQELTGPGDGAVTADVRAAEAAIGAVLGEKPQPSFTPYAAAMDERVRSLVARAGYLPVA